MRFFKFIGMLCLAVITSFYFFPFEFTFLPTVNTKMAMAAVGLVLFLINLARGKNAALDESFFRLSLIAVLVSIIAFGAAVINNTNDYTYASYIVSMWVWLGGAYTVLCCIRAVHGGTSVILVGNYLIAVCVGQCAMALAIDSFPTIDAWVNRLVVGVGFTEQEFLENSDRLYGIGCALDVAGTRFSCVLALIAFLSIKLANGLKRWWLWLYLFAFVVIVVVGSMIARTTYVGAGMALAVWLLASVFRKVSTDLKYLWTSILSLLLIGAIVCAVLYSSSPVFKNNLRFAFEGFFSLAEKGEWDVNSNNILKTMIVFPDNFRTWIIGDGYMENPFWYDPNYVGRNFRGYYMQTDIGYLRFIFYFGLIGLLTFCYFMFACARELVKRLPEYKWLFISILLINFTVWAKVSTDVFPMFAILLCIPPGENMKYETLFDNEQDS